MTAIEETRLPNASRWGTYSLPTAGTRSMHIQVFNQWNKFRYIQNFPKALKLRIEYGMDVDVRVFNPKFL
jgi:hypothetical protein